MIIVDHVLPLFVPAVVSSFKADFAQMDFKTAIANPECKHCHSDTKDSNFVIFLKKNCVIFSSVAFTEGMPWRSMALEAFEVHGLQGLGGSPMASKKLPAVPIENLIKLKVTKLPV